MTSEDGMWYLHAYTDSLPPRLHLHVDADVMIGQRTSHVMAHALFRLHWLVVDDAAKVNACADLQLMSWYEGEDFQIVACYCGECKSQIIIWGVVVVGAVSSSEASPHERGTDSTLSWARDGRHLPATAAIRNVVVVGCATVLTCRGCPIIQTRFRA